MFFARKFQRFFSLLALLIWVHLDICTAYALARSATYVPSVKITPLTGLMKRHGGMRAVSRGG